jgi:hypothetical protein
MILFEEQLVLPYGKWFINGIVLLEQVKGLEFWIYMSDDMMNFEQFWGPSYVYP